jgi:hypothetical protein
METLVQVVTVALAVVAIIWHQQRTIDKLRDGTNQAFDKLRDGTSQAIGQLSTEVAANGQRLARIEGFLGIGIPEATPPPQRPTEAEEPGG